MDTLFSVPGAVGAIVTTPVPVGLIVTLAFAPVTDTAPVADNAVKTPVVGVVAPMVMLLIVPGFVGLIITVPVPVGLIVIFEFAEENVTAPVTVNALNVPARGVVAPIVTLSSVPSVDGLTAKVLLTTRFAILPLVLNVSVFVPALVEIAIPLVPARVNVLLVEFNPTVVCPATAR
jgi:hypothetical protein